MGKCYPPGSDEAAVVQVIEAFTRCLVEGDVAGWMSYWDDNAMLLPPGYPRVVGRDRIETYIRAYLRGTRSVEISNVDVEVFGDLAVAVIDSTWGSAAGNSGTLKEFMVMKRGKTPPWVRTKVMFNSAKR